MGYSSYNEASATTLSTTNVMRSRGLAPSFAYTSDVRQGKVEAKVHDLLEPRGATRESRDSEAHPASVPVAVFFDVTGSMGTVPRVFQGRLANLMTLLTQHGYLTDPQVLLGAVGDAVSDRGPLQVGQFESSIEVDDDLERMWLEGGGGGSRQESYELAHYFVARHVRTDAWDRRRRKGYLFTLGDEAFYPDLPPRRLRERLGDEVPAAVTTAAVVAELQARWHVFHLHVQEGSYRDDPAILGAWRGLLGDEHVLLLERSDSVAEVVALVVGLVEGTAELASARATLAQLGLSADAVDAIASTLAPVAARAVRIRDGAGA